MGDLFTLKGKSNAEINYILTNRLHKLFSEVKKIIDNNSIFVEDIFTKNDGYHMSDKFNFILNFMKENTQYKKVRFYDDDVDTINSFKDNLHKFKEIGVDIEVFLAKKGNIKKI